MNKKSVSLLANLVLAGTLLWGVPAVDAEESIVKVRADSAPYCHMKFPALRQDSLSWERPMLETGEPVIDLYGSCDYDPLGPEEIRAQRRRGFGDE